MSTDTLSARAKAQTIYLVRVTTKHGSYSIGWDDPARVLKAVAEFHENGFGEVGVYDLEGRKFDLAQVEAAAKLTNPMRGLCV